MDVELNLVVELPVSTASAGSAGVDGVLKLNRSFFFSSNNVKSVNVPPTSTPILQEVFNELHPIKISIINLIYDRRFYGFLKV